MGIGLVGIFLPFNTILLKFSLVDKFFILNFKLASQVSITRVSSSETADMLFSIYVQFFIHTSFALNWLQKVPKLKKLWMKVLLYGIKGGFSTQMPLRKLWTRMQPNSAEDTESFLFARAEELVIGGLLAVIKPAVPNVMSSSDTFSGTELDLLGYCLMDMAKVVSKRIFNSSSLTLVGEILDKLGVTFNKLKQK